MNIREAWATKESIDAYQRAPNVHPLTCGNDSRHRVLEAYLKWIGETYEVRLMCIDCEWEQALPVMITMLCEKPLLRAV